MSDTRATYKDAGVDIDAGLRAVSLMKDAVSATHGPAVLAGVGAFGGLFSLKGLANMAEPVLAASADGVGTKCASRIGTTAEGIGADLVNHCINDIWCRALIALLLGLCSKLKLDPVEIATVVGGMAKACRHRDALLGGETAEMRGLHGWKSMSSEPSSGPSTGMPSPMAAPSPPGMSSLAWLRRVLTPMDTL